MSNILSRLQSLSLFKSLKNDKRALEKIAALIRTKTFKPESYIIREGENGDAMYILNQGAVRVEKNTLLHRICGADELSVNSAHHQAVKSVGPGVIVDAIAPDGVIEGIEDPRYRYCLGVQWHPEYSISVGDQKIFDAFVDAAR